MHFNSEHRLATKKPRHKQVLGKRGEAFAARYLREAPMAAKLALVFGWFAGALAGGWTAAKIGLRSWLAWVPAGLVLLGGIANMMLIAHPAWMMAAGVVAPLVGGWLASRGGTRVAAA